jgi:hypothetical protein
MRRHGRSTCGRAATVALLAGVLALGLAASAGAASKGSAQALPKACKLLKRTEAQALAGVKLQPPIDAGQKCAYNSYPTGTVAQVFVYVSPSVPTTLQIDRKLGHKFWKVRGLGDVAWAEEWAIFVRTGKVWVTINLVRIDAWPSYKKRMEHAAAIAIARVKPPKRKLASVGAQWHPVANGDRERWTGKERRFGGSVTSYPGVVYQPGVVLIGGGSRAVRGRSADGLTWTIDGRAPGAADLGVGKIMLATTFASGRVLKLTRAGRNLGVVLGPVALTDIVRDGVFDSDGPVSLANPLVLQTKLPTKPPKRKRTIQGSFAESAGGAFSSTPICCAHGIGVHVGYQSDAGRLSGTISLDATGLAVDFRIRISGGRLLEAALELRGAAALDYDLDGATKSSSGNVKSGPIAVPGSLTIPLAGPLAITLSQSFQISLQLSGQASLHVNGRYAVNGRLAFGYTGGRAAAADAGLQPVQPVTKSTLSLGVGTNAISVGWAIKATVGIGLGPFTAGVWFALKPGLAVAADGSHLQSLKLGCVTAALDVTSEYGVGFDIPEFVQSVVNAILGALRVKPIPTTIGPSWGPSQVFGPTRGEYCPPRKQRADRGGERAAP